MASETARNTTHCVTQYCEDHRYEVLAFCETCEKRLCKDCLRDHDGHAIPESKKIHEEKVTALKQAIVKARELQADLTELNLAIQEKQALHIHEIEKAYQKAIETVNQWRDDLLIKVTRYDDWLLDCIQAKKRLHRKSERTKYLIRLSKEQLSGPKGLSELIARTDDPSSNLQDDLQHYGDFIKEIYDRLNSSLVFPKLVIGEKNTSQTIPDEKKTVSKHVKAEPDVLPAESTELPKIPDENKTVSKHANAGAEVLPAESTKLQEIPDEKKTVSIHANAGAEVLPAESTKFQDNISLHLHELEKACKNAVRSVYGWEDDTKPKGVSKLFARPSTIHGPSTNLQDNQQRYGMSNEQISGPSFRADTDASKWFAGRSTIHGPSTNLQDNQQRYRMSNEQIPGPSFRAVTDASKWFAGRSTIHGPSTNLQDNQQRYGNWKLNSIPASPNLIERSYISTPELTFMQPGEDSVQIIDRGKVLISVKDNLSDRFAGAVTDGRLQTGKHYWEVEASFLPNMRRSKREWVFSAGIANCVPNKWYVGACDRSWGVVLTYSDKQYIFYCRYFGRRRTDPVFVNPRTGPMEVSVRVGFYLDCTEQTLTILDHTTNRELHKFNHLDMFQPFIPAVSVHGDKCANRSVRLMRGNLSTLFQAQPHLRQN